MITLAEILKWDESQHPRDEQGQFEPARGIYLAQYPNFQPELDAFIAKNPHKAKADLELLTRGGKVQHPVRDVIPSYEFQVQVEQAAHKRLSKERRQEKQKAKDAAKPKLLEQMQTKYGYTEGDTVFDSQTGTKGKVRWGRDGQPYVETAMGKHYVGARWKKAQKP